MKLGGIDCWGEGGGCGYRTDRDLLVQGLFGILTIVMDIQNCKCDKIVQNGIHVTYAHR